MMVRAVANPLKYRISALDLVVIDDFIYTEPQAVPETSSLVLLTTGLVALGFGAFRRFRK